MGYDIRSIVMAVPVILFALTVHEFFHAWTANKFGDPTAKMQGRLSLNPLAHLDLMGTLMLFLSGFRFGWAKPVPVNPYNLRNYRHDNFWISAAGPLSNLGMAFIAGTIIRFVGLPMSTAYFGAFDWLLYFGLSINVSLAVFNLLPLHPLDGSHILESIVPEQYGHYVDQFSRIAPMILMVLIFSSFFLKVSLIWIILGPFVRAIMSLFSGLNF